MSMPVQARKLQDALRTGPRNLGQDIIRLTQKQVFAIARKTLTDLAGASLEERMGDVFVQRVRALTGEARSSWRRPSSPRTIR